MTFLQVGALFTMVLTIALKAIVIARLGQYQKRLSAAVRRLRKARGRFKYIKMEHDRIEGEVIAAREKTRRLERKIYELQLTLRQEVGARQREIKALAQSRNQLKKSARKK